MDQPVPGTQPSTRPSEDRLNSWKEIAAYLDRDVTTVQHWEKRKGMPVRSAPTIMEYLRHEESNSYAWARFGEVCGRLPLFLCMRKDCKSNDSAVFS
jgi:hypothetical protein